MFKDPIKDKPSKNNGVPYDERTGVYVNQGTYHGTGYTNPVGSTGSPKQFVETLPQGRVKTMRIDQLG